jgi:hypothetical protein
MGVDLCPHRRPETALGSPRASFEVHDVNAGLERFQQNFDVLHARNLSQGVSVISNPISFISPLFLFSFHFIFISFHTDANPLAARLSKL